MAGKYADYHSKIMGNYFRYFQNLVPITGSHKANLFFCYLLHWVLVYESQGELNPFDRWQFYDANEIEAAIGLTYKEQIAVRRNLREKDLIEERRTKENYLARNIDFRIKKSTYDKVIDEFLNS